MGPTWTWSSCTAPTPPRADDRRAPGHQPTEQFYTRLGQRLIHMMTTQTAAGHALRGRHAPAPGRQQGHAGPLAHRLRRLPGERGLDLGTPGPGARPPRRRGPALARALRRGPPSPSCAARATRERLREEVARHARRKMRADALDKSARRRALRPQAGARRYCRYRVYGSIRGPALGRGLPGPGATGPTTSASWRPCAGWTCCPARAAADLTEAYKALRAAYHRSCLAGPAQARRRTTSLLAGARAGHGPCGRS